MSTYEIKTYKNMSLLMNSFLVSFEFLRLPQIAIIFLPSQNMY